MYVHTLSETSTPERLGSEKGAKEGFVEVARAM